MLNAGLIFVCVDLFMFQSVLYSYTILELGKSLQHLVKKSDHLQQVVKVRLDSLAGSHGLAQGVCRKQMVKPGIEGFLKSQFRSEDKGHMRPWASPSSFNSRPWLPLA